SASSNSWADAMWIWDEADANKVPQNNEPRYLRLSFNLSAAPQAAELWVTADNLYVAHVNGVKVGDGKEWAIVDKYDVAKHLVAGKNVLAIKATNQGGVAGAIARLHIKTADKKDLFIVTDERTKITAKPPQGAFAPPRGQRAWTDADFDDSAWFNAIVLGDTSIAPWNIGGDSLVKGKGKKGGPTDYGSTAVDKAVTKRLTAQEQLKHFIVPKDFEIELVAADPVIINPITMVLDGKGRIIVSESHTYRFGPPGSPIKPYANPVVRLDPDGKGGFTRTLVADGFTDPVMGIAVKGNKLWLTACDYLYTYDLPADGEAKDEKKDARRPLDDKQKEQLKKALAVAGNRFEETEQRRGAALEIAVLHLQSKNPEAVDALLSLLPGDLDGFTVHAARALLLTGDPKALAVLEKLGIAFPDPRKAGGPFPPGPVVSRELAMIRGEATAKIKAKAKQKEAPTEGKGIATNKKLLLKDHSKAWNPFGMFVLEWGPDGKLYMSVGNHNINIEGPDGGKISARGSSGMVMRMNPDGTKMERLVHGLRVPYSFEMDPFGQLWLLSNGEGNPDRFVRVIEGVDYHCYSRGVSNEWLAGREALAPPCEEVHGGAHTQLLRYYAAAYPQEYQGNLFACNWGRHGFAGANRGIFRFVLDERNNVVKKDTLLACTDPHFRPSHIHLDVDGSLLIADWYGRDDESDMTGRIWRLKYVGKNAPVVKHKLDAPEWKEIKYAFSALGSPDHLIREKAMNELLARNPGDVVGKLRQHALDAKEPLGAANALWAILRIKKWEALDGWIGSDHPDWKVRRLAVNLSRRYEPNAKLIIPTPIKEKDPAVLLETNIADNSPKGAGIGLFDALGNGAAADPHLRYEAAWHFAKHADINAFTAVLTDKDSNIRLAGLIAIDVACYENFPTKKIALAALAKALENPGKLDHQLLLTVAQLDGDASIVPALEKLIARDDLPTATIAKAVLVLKAKAGGSLTSTKLSAAAGKRLIEAVEKGSLKIASPADQLVIFEFLESEGPTPFALKQIEGQLRSANPALKQASHTLARRFGPKADSLAGGLWPNALNPKTKFEDSLEYLSTIARVEEAPDADRWFKMLNHNDPFVRMETVRWWRNFKGRPNFSGLLNDCRPNLVKDANLQDDLDFVSRHLERKPPEAVNKDALTKYALKELADMPATDRTKRSAMGLQVFERNSCTKCHTTATATTLLAPSLKGVAQQKPEYLIESVLYPSKIIKTGWELETIELKSGKVLSGLVKDEGKTLRVIQAMDYLAKPLVIDKADIDARSVSKISLMPEGQEATLSRREFVDLIAYLQTLK
ncbi:MAG: hypothetical protein HY289_03340, partial [Planctomycetes bacterium]|nr:hypothetical protein [Planctomycetota bacterium]